MRFRELHPAVNIVWFAAVGTITVLYMNPVTLLITLISACIFLHFLGGSKFGVMLLPMMLMCAVINPLFSHEGVTVLAYFPSGNPLTLESIIYGVGAALMIGSALVLCLCFSATVTADKLMWLVGRLLPSAAMLITMTLRFVPRFTSQLKASYASRCALLGKPEKRMKKLAIAASVVSNTVTWAIEGSLTGADSMKCRGWGLPGRTSFSPHRFEERDRTALIIITALTFYFICGYITGSVDMRYYPTFRLQASTSFGISVIGAYALLCFYPVITEVYYGIFKNK